MSYDLAAIICVLSHTKCYDRISSYYYHMIRLSYTLIFSRMRRWKEFYEDSDKQGEVPIDIIGSYYTRIDMIILSY